MSWDLLQNVEDNVVDCCMVIMIFEVLLEDVLLLTSKMHKTKTVNWTIEVTSFLGPDESRLACNCANQARSTLDYLRNGPSG